MTIVIQLLSKEATVWLRETANELEFTSKLNGSAFIVDRTYPILVPRFPLSFDPVNKDHLCEVESTNDLPPKTISKARWIKPENIGDTHTRNSLLLPFHYPQLLKLTG
jgi:hypothetical protein